MYSICPFSRVVLVALILIALASAQTIDAKPRNRSGKPKQPTASRGQRQNVVKKASGLTRRRGRELAARRKAEAARIAAARQRAREDEMRERVQNLIAHDDVTGEDLEIRRIAVNALGNRAGTVVVMDPQTGRIFTIVNQQWGVRQGFKPCSTIKLVTSLAGLNEAVINPANTTAISNSNQVSLTKALAYSKNDYFQQVGGQVGFDKMLTYARHVGLGSRTGVNLSNESAGRLPGSKPGRGVNRVFSHGDGFTVTALQLAKMASVFANRGKLVVPFVPRAASPTSKPGRQVNYTSTTWQSMVPGMVGAVQYGSGRKAYDPTSTIAGKTGTCIENGSWVGLFTSYAPLNNPRLAIAVIARGSDGRNHIPAAVAGRIYRALNHRFGTEQRPEIAKASESPNTSSDEEAEVENEEEAGEEEAASIDVRAEELPAPKTIWKTSPRSADSKVRLTAMPVSNTGQTSNPSIQIRPRRVTASSQK